MFNGVLFAFASIVFCVQSNAQGIVNNANIQNNSQISFNTLYSDTININDMLSSSNTNSGDNSDSMINDINSSSSVNESESGKYPEEDTTSSSEQEFTNKQDTNNKINYDDFFEKWQKYVISKDKSVKFEEVNAFLEKYKKTIPMQDSVIAFATEKLEDSKMNFYQKFLWLYNHNRDFFLKCHSKGISKSNYQSVLQKKHITSIAQLKIFLGEQSYFEYLSDMLWNDKFDDVNKIVSKKNIKKKLSSKQLGIIYSRLYLAKNNKKFIRYKNYFAQAIKNNYHLSDEGLLYGYIKYIIRTEDYNDTINKLIPKVLSFKSHEIEWWGVKEILIIELLKKADYKNAFYVANPDNITDSQNLARARWVRGFIALKFLEQYEIAADYFKSVYADFTFSATKSRGAYWAGRAYEKLEDSENAYHWYEKASEYPLTFYGQESILKRLNMQDDRLFYKDREANEDVNFFSEQMVIFNKIFNDIKTKITQINDNLNSDVQKKLEKNFLWIGGLYLYKQNYQTQAMEFFQTLVKTQDRMVVMLAIYKLKSLLSYYEYRTIKSLVSWLNIPLLDVVYNHELPNTRYNNKALIYAIIQRESSFKIDAVSPVGALGLMQVMPETARQICREIGLKYNYVHMLNDASYNVELGSYYINKLLDAFDNAYPLAIASYNGGPHSVKMWLDRNEFIQTTDDVIDWIELISYKETRNYVMRVLENEIIYRYITRFGPFYANNKWNISNDYDY